MTRPAALIGLAALGLSLLAGAALAEPLYRPAGEVPIGSPDRWDYVTFDPSSGRVYVAHSDTVAVVDPDAKRLVGAIGPAPGGTHGIAVDPAARRGYTDDGKAGEALAFDPSTLKVTARIPAAPDADGIAFDPNAGRVFIIAGDSQTVLAIDPRTNAVVARIPAEEGLEFGDSDRHGHLFVAGVEKGDLIRIDEARNVVDGRFPAAGCSRPHGLAVDSETRRIFMSCVNQKLMVLNGETGAVVAELPIGRGSDAVAFDPVRKRIFSSNGADGNISVIQEDDADHYRALEPVPSAVTGRTMAVDPKTGRLFVAAAEAGPPATPGGRPRPVPNSFKLLIFAPVR